MSSQFRIFDNIIFYLVCLFKGHAVVLHVASRFEILEIFYLNLQIPWEVKGKSVNRLAGSQVNKVNPSNNSNNLQGRWDRKKTFVWSVATEPRVTTTTRWLAKAAKAFLGGPSPKTRDMLANILEILVKLTCTWGENAKRAGIVLLIICSFIVLQFRKKKHLSNMIKTNSRILQNVLLLLNFLQISLLTYVFVKSKSIFQRFNLSMAWEKNMCRTYPSMTCRFYLHTYQFFFEMIIFMRMVNK